MNTSSKTFSTILIELHASNGSEISSVPSNWPDKGLNPIGDSFMGIPLGYFTDN